MFSEPKYADDIKLLLLSGFKLFDSVFKMVEMQFWTIISNALKFLDFTSKISCWFNTSESFDPVWSYLSSSCLGDLLYRYGTQISFSINKMRFCLTSLRLCPFILVNYLPHRIYQRSFSFAFPLSLMLENTLFVQFELDFSSRRQNCFFSWPFKSVLICPVEKKKTSPNNPPYFKPVQLYITPPTPLKTN